MMLAAAATVVAPRCPWDSRDDFLLLPGDGLILVDGDGVITYFDHRARLLMAREPRCRSGDSLDLIWPELAAAIEEHSDAASHLGPLDTRLTCGGQRRTVRLFRTDSGVGIVLLADRPAAPEASQEHLRMHERILQHIRDAVIVTTAEPVDPPGPVIVYANNAALRQTGYRLEEILGRSPRLFQGPATDPAALRSFHAALRHWQPVRQRVLNYRKDGSIFWVEIDIAPLEDSDGWYTYWVSVQRECEAPRRSA
ncbi:MAG: hypothetical protein ER33_03295 [Cyanobium sp. CACIAM 14]|nr:MAG: hypothetical protein ER33_03295 [Cyanobium sp. CACIAM 14]